MHANLQNRKSTQIDYRTGKMRTTGAGGQKYGAGQNRNKVGGANSKRLADETDVQRVKYIPKECKY